MASRKDGNGEGDLIAHVDAGFSAVVSALDHLAKRLDNMNADLGKRIDNVAFGAMGGAVRRHDDEIRDLDARVKRLERKRA